MIYLFLAVIFYSLSLMLGASASRNANTNLVSFINALFSVFIPLAVILPKLSKGAFTNHKYGVTMAALSGLVVSVFVLSLSKSFSQNKIGIITPVIFGGAIFITSIASYFVFKEKISLIEGAGLGLVLAYVIFIKAFGGMFRK